MSNRIGLAIEKMKKRLVEVPKEKKDSLTKSLNETDLNELFEFQKVQSLAFACGAINFDEAQTLFRIYGGDVPTTDKWKKLPLEEKIIGTQTAHELINKCKVL